MNKAKEHALYRSNFEDDVPSYEDAPSYSVGTSSSARNALGTTVTIDPTGMSVISLPLGSGAPLYTFSSSLNHVHSLSPGIDISRPDEHSAESLRIYSVAERFIEPLHPVKPSFKYVTAVRSTGLAAALGLRKTVWDFYTVAPIPKEAGGRTNPQHLSSGETAGDFLVTLGSDGIGMQKDLLRFFDGRWVTEDDEVIALAREGGVECEGMPVLSVVKELDQMTLDFLVAAWCVTLWGSFIKGPIITRSESDSYSG